MSQARQFQHEDLLGKTRAKEAWLHPQVGSTKNRDTTPDQVRARLADIAQGPQA